MCGKLRKGYDQTDCHCQRVEERRGKEGGRERWEAGGGRSRFPPSGWLVVRDVRPI